MRRFVVIVVLALLVGGVVASLMMRDPGYVLLVYDELSFESSLWFALLALAVVYVVLRLVWGIAARLFRTSSGLRSWSESRRARQAHEQTLRGVLLLAEGEWTPAREALLGAVARAELPLVNYLGAARAAAAMGEWDACDSLLAHAMESTPGASIGVRLEGAELKAMHGRHADARKTLEALHREVPRHALVLRRLVACHRALGDWAALLALADALKKSKSFSDEEVDRILEEAAGGALESAGTDALAGIWESLPKGLRERPAVVAAYAVASDRAGAGDVAEAAVRRALAHAWDPALVDVYGRLTSADAARQAATAEAWLAGHADDATLLLALGRIAQRQRDWARARECFESSLRRSPGAAVYGELGRLCLALGERDRAAEYLAQSVGLGAVALPELPLPG